MKANFYADLQKAGQLTSRHNVGEATRVIQHALSRLGRAKYELEEQSPENSPPRELEASVVETSGEIGAPRHGARTARRVLSREAVAERGIEVRGIRPLGQVLEFLRQGDLAGLALGAKAFAPARHVPVAPTPEGASFTTRTFTCETGSRDYKLFVPSPAHADGRKRPLIIMLHGCSQNPDDFAVGTNMNLLAEEQGFIVAYPSQSTSANPSGCWNWFSFKDQMRGAGEPSIIAGMTHAIIKEFEIDAGRVFVAGLSAGGAMAEVMGATYPELYAATGVHSGLAYGSATDLPSAFAAMHGRRAPTAIAQGRAPVAPSRTGSEVRTIVFHGAADVTVHPSNADMIVAAARAGLEDAAEKTQHGRSAAGVAYERTVIKNARGVHQVEYWAIHGLGHAWSGGNPEGSYTDPRGPDASREMLRFFFEGPARLPLN
jgi:poly(hydroxyalkanoate) depolymerase family esterase